MLKPIPPGWRENVLLVAGLKTETFSDFKDTCEDLADNYYPYQTPNFIKCYGDDGEDNADAKNAIDGGISSVVYFGYGRNLCWYEWNNENKYPLGPNWFYYNIESLTNFTKLPIVFNITCLNGRITENYGDVLCESWMSEDYDNNRYIGAVTTVGFSHVHYHQFCNQPATKLLYHYIYDTEKANNKGISWLVYTANVKEYYKWVNHDWEYHNMYACIILGDPALRIRRKSSEVKENIINNNIKLNKLDELKSIEIKIINPVYDSIKMFINTNKEENINIDIYDMSGRKLDEFYCGKLNIGENEIEINNINLNIGLYILNIYSDNFNEVRKVVVFK
ncbi:MAG: C25 family cysteine peptidase [bacterium]